MHETLFELSKRGIQSVVVVEDGKPVRLYYMEGDAWVLRKLT